MKKPIIALLLITVMSLVWSFFPPSYAQDPTNEEKPTFYRLVPGTYVNGWPRFTISYPKDWVERSPGIAGFNVFAVSSPKAVPYPELRVVVYPYHPGWDSPDFFVPFFKSLGFRDVTVVSEKPSQLRDGSPAREIKLSMVINGAPAIQLILVTKRGDMLVRMEVRTLGEKIGEELKAILYSLEFQPDKDKPVEAPPDVQEFLERTDNDMVSHDVAKVISHHSDRYLNSGWRKGEIERMWRQFIGGWMSLKTTITDFVSAGDRAYLTGFGITNFGTVPFTMSIIKENGEWKWYGNQRDVTP
jgi:hypothetical protein